MSDITYHWGSGREVDKDELSEAQWETILILIGRHDIPSPVEIIPGMGYVGVMAGNMFIGVEPDGHSHT